MLRRHLLPRPCASSTNTERRANIKSPIEPHGVIAQWKGEKLTIWEPSQWLDGMARTYAEWFGIPFENVRLISPYIGGGFGSKGFAYAHDAIAAIAAKMLGASGQARDDPAAGLHRHRRPGGDAPDDRARRHEGGQAALDRPSRRQRNLDEGGLGRAARLGHLDHVCDAEFLFAPERRAVNTVMPGALRAPGENPSAFGIECAIDELAYEVGIDPLAIRLLNYAEEDPHAKKPWSTRQLREAFAAGADAFGWSQRSPGAAIDARRQRADRLGRGGGHLSGSPLRLAKHLSASLPTARSRSRAARSTWDRAATRSSRRRRRKCSAFPWTMSWCASAISGCRGRRVTGGSRIAGVMTGAVHNRRSPSEDELIGLAITHEDSPFRDRCRPTRWPWPMARIASPRGEGPGIRHRRIPAAIGRDKVEAIRDTFAEKSISPEDRYKNYTTIATGLLADRRRLFVA